MIIVLTENGKPVDAFLKTDGTDERVELDSKSPMAKLLVATVDSKATEEDIEEFNDDDEEFFDPDGRRAEMPWDYGRHFDDEED